MDSKQKKCMTRRSNAPRAGGLGASPLNDGCAGSSTVDVDPRRRRNHVISIVAQNWPGHCRPIVHAVAVTWSCATHGTTANRLLAV